MIDYVKVWNDTMVSLNSLDKFGQLRIIESVIDNCNNAMLECNVLSDLYTNLAQKDAAQMFERNGLCLLKRRI